MNRNRTVYVVNINMKIMNMREPGFATSYELIVTFFLGGGAVKRRELIVSFLRDE
jgi:hypothetical protein